MTLEQALDKTYEVRSYKDKRGYFHNVGFSLPNILIGHKVKLVLVDDSHTQIGLEGV